MVQSSEALPHTAAQEPMHASGEHAAAAARDEHEFWEERTRVVLTPYSPPSIIGLYGFFGATLMVAAWQAGWYGTADSGFVLFPFAAIFGGVFQGGAAFPALRARDGLAAGIHATWGAFWIAFGILFLMGATGVLKLSTFGEVDTPFAFWFIVLTMITGAGAAVAFFDNLSVFTVLAFLTVGAGFTAAGWIAGSAGVLAVGGWLFVLSALAAFYTASGMVAMNALGREVLPLGARHAVPGHPIQYPAGMPGVKVGQ